MEAYTIEWQAVIDLSPSEVDKCRQKIHRRHRLLDLLGRDVGSVDDHGNTRAVLIPAQKQEQLLVRLSSLLSIDQ